MSEGDICSVCVANGRENRLCLFQINLTEAIVMCPEPQCTYPIGNKPLDGLVKERKATDIVITKPIKKSRHSLTTSSRSSSTCSSPLSVDSLESSFELCRLKPNRSLSKDVLHAVPSGKSAFVPYTPQCSTSKVYPNQKHMTARIKTADKIKPGIEKLPQWENIDALCWLDVLLTVIVHNKSFIDQASNMTATSVLATLLAAYQQAKTLLNTSPRHREPLAVHPIKVQTGGGPHVMIESHSPPISNVKTKRTATPQSDSKPMEVTDGEIELANFLDSCEEPTDRDTKKTSESKIHVRRKQALDKYGVHAEDLEQACAVMDNVRQYIWSCVQPSLQCKKGKHDSPVVAMPVVMKLMSLHTPLLLHHTWSFTCSECNCKKMESQRKVLLTFPTVPVDFSAKNPCFVRPCFSCKIPGQKMYLTANNCPPLMMFHFVEGLPSNDVNQLTFVQQQYEYRVVSIVQYKQNPDHFVAWVKHPSGNIWMECDDLKPPVCSFDYETLEVPASQIHIVVWERSPLVSDNSQDCADTQESVDLKGAPTGILRDSTSLNTSVDKHSGTAHLEPRTSDTFDKDNVSVKRNTTSVLTDNVDVTSDSNTIEISSDNDTANDTITLSTDGADTMSEDNIKSPRDMHLNKNVTLNTRVTKGVNEMTTMNSNPSNKTDGSVQDKHQINSDAEKAKADGAASCNAGSPDRIECDLLFNPVDPVESVTFTYFKPKEASVRIRNQDSHKTLVTSKASTTVVKPKIKKQLPNTDSLNDLGPTVITKPCEENAPTNVQKKAPLNNHSLANSPMLVMPVVANTAPSMNGSIILNRLGPIPNPIVSSTEQLLNVVSNTTRTSTTQPLAVNSNGGLINNVKQVQNVSLPATTATHTLANMSFIRGPGFGKFKSRSVKEECNTSVVPAALRPSKSANKILQSIVAQGYSASPAAKPPAGIPASVTPNISHLLSSTTPAATTPSQYTKRPMSQSLGSFEKNRFKLIRDSPTYPSSDNNSAASSPTPSNSSIPERKSYMDIVGSLLKTSKKVDQGTKNKFSGYKPRVQHQESEVVTPTPKVISPTKAVTFSPQILTPKPTPTPKVRKRKIPSEKKSVLKKRKPNEPKAANNDKPRENIENLVTNFLKGIGKSSSKGVKFELMRDTRHLKTDGNKGSPRKYLLVKKPEFDDKDCDRIVPIAEIEVEDDTAQDETSGNATKSVMKELCTSLNLPVSNTSNNIDSDASEKIINDLLQDTGVQHTELSDLSPLEELTLPTADDTAANGEDTDLLGSDASKVIDANISDIQQFSLDKSVFDGIAEDLDDVFKDI